MRIESSFVSMWSKTDSSRNNHDSGSSVSFSDFIRAGSSADTSRTHNDAHRHGVSVMRVNFVDNLQAVKGPTASESEAVEIDINDFTKKKMQILQELLERLTGKKVRIHYENAEESDFEGVNLVAFTGMHQHWGELGNSIELRPVASVNAMEDTVDFASSGVIKTSNGKEINFAVNLSLNKDFIGDNVTKTGTGNVVDPLVINFATDSTKLSSTEINFDMDMDGNKENLDFVGEGSGFLAIDLNNDGIVNNGGELFGPKSGDGFLDLAVYDADKNNWIDENDSVFQKLSIWTKDSNGTDSLRSLGTLGIGAIFLGSTATDYNISTQAAAITQTGIFVRENGTTGTVQDMDYMI